MDRIHIMHYNINGLRGRLSELKVYINEAEPDVICLNETKLAGNPAPPIPGYNIACLRDRVVDNTNGGGVIIYVKKNFPHTDISPDKDDFAAVLLNKSNNGLAIIAYYCPPGKAALDSKLLNTYLRKHKNLIVTGDLNSKHAFYGSSKTNTRGDTLFNFVEENDATVANDPLQPTRFDLSKGKSDIVDYIIVSNSLAGKISACYTGEDIGSDHLPLHITLSHSNPLSDNSTKFIRPLKKCNWNQFNELLQNANNNLIKYNEKMEESLLENKALEFETTVTKAFEEACPLVEVKAYSFSVSPETLSLIKEKRRVRRLAQRNIRFNNTYLKLQRKVKSKLDKEKEAAWHAATTELNQTDNQTFWKTFKRLTGTSKTSIRRVPKLEVEGIGLTNCPTAVAEAFASSLQDIHNIPEDPAFDKEFKLEVDSTIQENKEYFLPNFDPATPMEPQTFINRTGGPQRTTISHKKVQNQICSWTRWIVLHNHKTTTRIHFAGALASF